MKPKFVILLVFVLSMVSLTYSSELKRQNAFTKVDAPAIYYNQKALLKSASLGYDIYYSPDFPLGGIRDAIGKAMEIWSYVLYSNQPIRISIKKADLGDNTIASTKTDFYNFPSGTSIAGVKLNFQYPMSLAKALANVDLNAGFSGDKYYDMIITINNKKITSNEFSYDLNGEPVANKIDLVSIIMHEIGHGLGITGSMGYDANTNQGRHDMTGYDFDISKSFPTIFDYFGVVDAVSPNNKRLLDINAYPNNSTTLGAALTSDNLYFDGPKSIAAAQSSLPKLYAPNPWLDGSSFSHLDELKYPEGNSNSLMTYQSEFAEVIHSPGEVGLALLEDMGWKVNRLITVTSPVPDGVCKRYFTYQISWTDNKANAINIKLYKKNSSGTFEYVRLLSALNTTIVGVNTWSWAIPSDITDGSYKIKMELNNEIFGESGVFIVSDLNQVATPSIYPTSRSYSIQREMGVTITCQTAGSDIYYTTNGSEPNTASNLYTGLFLVTPPCTVKAVASKSGMLLSNITNAIYSYNTNDLWFMKVDEQGEQFGGENENSNKGVEFWADGGYWCYYDTPVYFDRTSEYITGFYTIRTDQDLIPNKSGVNQKFWKWSDDRGNNNILNWGYYDLRGALTFTAQFKTPYTAKVQNTIEGFSGLTEAGKGDEVSFKDPWKYDKYVSTVSKYNQNSGDKAAPISYPSPLAISPTSVFKGVLLNATRNNTGTTYSVKAKTDVTLNGLAGKFVDWSSDGKATLSSPNSLESDVIFNAPDANVYARYKFVNKSNTATAFSNTSQRKFVRTDNGYLHLVYESMNHIWYERSTDNGSSWQIMNGGKCLDQGATQSKLPSIATMYNDIAIVWQEEYVGYYKIILARFDENSLLRYTTIVYDPAIEFADKPLYSTNADPVIAFNDCSTVLVCWKKEIPENPESSGIWYKLGQVYVDYDGAIRDVSRWYQEEMIPGTTVYSGTPTVSRAFLGQSFAVAWDRGGSYTEIDFAIMSYRVDESGEDNPGYVIYSIQQQAVSDWSYYQYHHKPSIALIPSSSGGGNLELGWVGERVYYENGVQKNIKNALYRRCSYSASTNTWNWAGVTWSMGTSNVSAVNVNTTNADGVVAWNEGGVNNRYARTSSPYTPRTFSNGPDLKGASLQVNNSTDFNTMYALAFNNSTIPYSFTRSFSVQQLGKTGSGSASERTAVARLDSAAFFVSSSRLLLDGKSLGFTLKSDSIKSYDLKSIEEALSTESFTPLANSSIYYDIEYGTLDTLYSMKALSKGAGIRCLLELQDVDNGNTLKVLERFSLDKLTMKGNAGSLKKVSGSLDVKQFAGRNLRLKLVIEDGINANWGLMERVLSPEEEHHIEKISQEKVTDYALRQNYPNPFNPSTVISYEIPKTSKVTLRIYDMLGKEVTTLVDEVKNAGKYSVEFNASSLPSGIYIYEIRANDFVRSGKTMLLK